MKNITYLFVLVLFSIVSCQSSTADSNTTTQATDAVDNTGSNYDYQSEIDGDLEGPMTITGIFANKNTYRGKYVRLYETEGKDLFQIDSALVQNGTFVLNPSKVKLGMHRIGVVPDERSLGTIVLNPNEKEITLNYRSGSFLKGVTVENSKENEGWLEYMEIKAAHKEVVKEIRNSGQERPVKLKRLYAAEEELKVKEVDYATRYAGTYFAKVVVRFQSPNRFEQGKYWSDFDFQDVSLIHSRVFTERIMDYMRVHAKKENTDKDPTLGYYNAVDIIANKVKETGDDRVLEFVLYTMSEGMYSSGHEDVSLYVIDNYFYGDACGDSEISELFKQKAAGIRNLQVGEKPPVFRLPGHDGKVVDLQKVIDANDYTLIFFWASYCHNCEAETPKLKTVYDKYKDKGFEVVGVSVDLQKNAWLKAIRENELEWYNCSDLKGWKGDNTRAYRVSKTPSMFLVNKNGKILVRGKSANQIINFLNKKFG